MADEESRADPDEEEGYSMDEEPIVVSNAEEDFIDGVIRNAKRWAVVAGLELSFLMNDIKEE